MKFFVHLDNPSQSYFTGQVVSGKVILELDREKTTSGLKLKCVGEADVHWTESRSYTTGSGNNRQTHHRTEHYRAHENYFEHKIYLIGNQNGPQITIPVGYQEFPFAFQLPSGIPSSFQGNHGYVQYYLHATIKRSWKFDHDAKLMFTVNGIVDLNVFPGAANPSEFRKEKNLCCMCCKSGPLGFTFKMNRAGFVPGEILQFSADLFNMSNRQLPGTKVKLVRVTSFHSSRKTRTSSTTVLEKRGPGIEPGENESWQGDSIQIPPIPPTDLGGCRIISVNYYLEMELTVPGGLDLSGTVPIIIGTIPFRNNFQELTSRASPVAPPQPMLPGGPQVQPSAPFEPGMFGYPDMPPPSYEQATQGGDKYEDIAPPAYGEEQVDGGGAPSAPTDGNFVPKYATYGWNMNRN